MEQKIINILLIDDNPATNLIHKKVLSKIAWVNNIHVCNGAEKALDFLVEVQSNEENNEPPQLIFLDINMPGMNGWEFIEEYENLPEDHKGQVMIMMLTTSINPDDRQKAISKKSITGFLNKPLTTKVVEKVLNDHLGINVS